MTTALTEMMVLVATAEEVEDSLDQAPDLLLKVDILEALDFQEVPDFLEVLDILEELDFLEVLDFPEAVQASVLNLLVILVLVPGALVSQEVPNQLSEVPNQLLEALQVLEVPKIGNIWLLANLVLTNKVDIDTKRLSLYLL